LRAKFPYCGAVPGDDHNEQAGEKVEGTMVRYKTTAKGEVALWHFRELMGTQRRIWLLLKD
jgi:hypothetical protein